MKCKAVRFIGLLYLAGILVTLGTNAIMGAPVWVTIKSCEMISWIFLIVGVLAFIIEKWLGKEYPI